VVVSDGGRVRWRTPLPVHGNEPSGLVQPAVAGPVTVVAQDGVVYGLRLADGRRLWSWGGGQSDYDLWPWGDLVVVLTDQASTQARLTGLNAATGRVSWSLRLPGKGLDGNLAATSDGGLAMIRADGVLQVVSLADSQVRWTRRTGAASLALVAASGVVAFGRDGQMTGYDDTTGQRRWTVTGLRRSRRRCSRAAWCSSPAARAAGRAIRPR
jgi:outer membrane protein assembly factor BamB